MRTPSSDRARSLMDKQEPLPPDARARRSWRTKLLTWYERNRRELPWRGDPDPYHIWLSEIMLQQTRVSAVLQYYRPFLQRFPTVRSLARAPESSVLAAWSGLGYYRRARLLHRAARIVVKRQRGKIPRKVEDLRTLPGVGRYTAAAIASISFGAPTAVVDGNVRRVIRRSFAAGERESDAWVIAQALLDQRRPGDFNQAMMDLGATVCLPSRPQCSICPVFDLCATQGNVRDRKRTNPVKLREITYALDRRGKLVFLVQRPRNSSLMGGMWELPEATPDGGQGKPCLTLRHSITVTNYHVRVVQGRGLDDGKGRWIPEGRVPRMPLTGLARKILQHTHII